MWHPPWSTFGHWGCHMVVWAKRLVAVMLKWRGWYQNICIMKMRRPLKFKTGQLGFYFVLCSCQRGLCLCWFMWLFPSWLAATNKPTICSFCSLPALYSTMRHITTSCPALFYIPQIMSTGVSPAALIRIKKHFNKLTIGKSRMPNVGRCGSF